MKIEIKKLRVNHRLSEETLNFSCDLYIDGKRAGEATNHGTGGETSLRIPRDLLERLEAYADATLVGDEGIRWSSEPNKGKLVEGAAQLIDKLVYAEDARKQREKHEGRIVKIDKSEVAKNTARGMGTIRWTCGTDTRWIGYPRNVDGIGPVEAAASLTARYARKGTPVTWVVLS